MRFRESHPEEYRKLRREKYWLPENRENRQRRLQRNRELYKQNIVKRRRDALERAKKLRFATLTRLGGKCVRCGFNDPRALQVDHINGGGNLEVKKLSQHGLYRLLSNLTPHELEGKYQLLCANCNWIKRFERNEINQWTTIASDPRRAFGRDLREEVPY